MINRINKGSTTGLIINVLVSVTVLGGAVYGFIALGEREQPQRRKGKVASGVPVLTVPVAAHTGSVTISANGLVVPYREIRMAAEVRGRIIEISPKLRSGRSVEKGETLLKLDPTDYHLEVERLRQQQAQVQAEIAALDTQVHNTNQLLELAKGDLELQQAELARTEALVEKRASSESGLATVRRGVLVSQNAVLRLENDLRSFDAQHILLDERQKLTQVELQRAQVDEQRTVLTSPVTGVIVQSSVEEQSYLQAGETFAVIEDSAAMEVRCSLTPDDMYWIWNNAAYLEGSEQSTDGFDNFAVPPTPATVRFQVGERRYEWLGTLTRQEGIGFDERTRTIPCRVRVDNPDQVRIVGAETPELSGYDGPRTLMRGMFVTVEIDCSPHKELLHIPEEAVRPGKRVWLASDGKLQICQVEVVGRHEDAVIVDPSFTDVHAGDQLIISPVPNVRNGMPVQTGPPGQGKKKKGAGGGGQGRGGRGGGPGAPAGGTGPSGGRGKNAGSGGAPGGPPEGGKKKSRPPSAQMKPAKSQDSDQVAEGES